jgi:hypothetical protein
LDEPFQPPENFVNAVSLPVLRELKGNWFQAVPFASQNGVLVLKPTGGWAQTPPSALGVRPDLKVENPI